MTSDDELLATIEKNVGALLDKNFIHVDKIVEDCRQEYKIYCDRVIAKIDDSDRMRMADQYATLEQNRKTQLAIVAATLLANNPARFTVEGAVDTANQIFNAL